MVGRVAERHNITDLRLLRRVHGIRTIPPIIASQPRPTSLFMQRSSLHTTCAFLFRRLTPVTQMIADSFDTSMSQKSRFKMQNAGNVQVPHDLPAATLGVRSRTLRTSRLLMGSFFPYFSLPMKFESFNVTHVQQTAF